MALIEVKIIPIPVIWSYCVGGQDLTAPAEVQLVIFRGVVGAALQRGDVDILWLLGLITGRNARN